VDAAAPPYIRAPPAARINKVFRVDAAMSAARNAKDDSVSVVMAGRVPAIHVFASIAHKTRITGT